MTLLIIGIIVFLGVHLLPTLSDLRGRLIARMGEGGYRALFSILSLLGFVLIVWGFAKAPVIHVWTPPNWTRYVAILLMVPVFILLFAAYLPGEIKSKVKHPFLVAIKTWALAHLIANGDLASIILFGSFLAYAVFDRMALQRRQPGGHVALAETGPPRNDMIAVVGGLILYVVFLVWLHPALDRHPTFAVNPGNRAQNKVALGSILRCKNPYILPPRIALCVTCSGVNRRG